MTEKFYSHFFPTFQQLGKKSTAPAASRPNKKFHPAKSGRKMKEEQSKYGQKVGLQKREEATTTAPVQVYSFNENTLSLARKKKRRHIRKKRHVEYLRPVSRFELLNCPPARTLHRPAEKSENNK